MIPTGFQRLNVSIEFFFVRVFKLMLQPFTHLPKKNISVFFLEFSSILNVIWCMFIAETLSDIESDKLKTRP